MSLQSWTGGAWLMPGFSVFQGAVGDNEHHAHFAHQIVIGRHSEVKVGLLPGRIHSPGIAIPANVPHCVVPADVLLIYLDPLTEEGRALFQGTASKERVLSASLCRQLLDSFQSVELLRKTLRAALNLPLPPAFDMRLPTVIAALQTSIASGVDIDREALAEIIALSPSRFSHWFVDQTGLPLRRYRKWLRLMVALNHVAQSASLTDAAHAAGFADSAHLSRTFREMFGINPSTALQHVRLHGSE